MFASNMLVEDQHIRHLRGEKLLTVFTQSKTIASGHEMSNHFCSKCGILMYRRSTRFPRQSFMRIGTVDDFNLHETNLKPQLEIFADHRVAWLEPLEGVQQKGKL
jgi:hypothetical protein